jgi:glutathione synthase
MDESVRLGHQSYRSEVRDIELRVADHVLVTARVQACGAVRCDVTCTSENTEVVDVCEFDRVFVRANPPVEGPYATAVRMLNALDPLRKGSGTSWIVNSPGALLRMNSRIAAGTFAGLTPRTCITANADVALQFGRSVHRTMIKPLNGFQGQGVHVVDWRTPARRARALADFKRATRDYSEHVVLQECLDVVGLGELRYWLVDGCVIGVVRKVATRGRMVLDTDLGDRLEPVTLTPRQVFIGERLGASLTREGVRLAAVDTIDNRVTDVNVISPGLLCEMETVLEANLAAEIVQRIVSR